MRLKTVPKETHLAMSCATWVPYPPPTSEQMCAMERHAARMW